MFGGAGGCGDQCDEVAGVEAVGEETAVLGFPEHGDRVHGLPVVCEGGQALPHRGVQGQREVVGL